METRILTTTHRSAPPHNPFTETAPWPAVSMPNQVRRDVQRVLDRAARRLMAEDLERHLPAQGDGNLPSIH
jgi:hypothetical protein